MLPLFEITLLLLIFNSSYQLSAANSETSVRDDLYSSIAMLEGVLEVEKIFVKTLENFIFKSESDIKSVKTAIRIFHNQTHQNLKQQSILFKPLSNFQSNVKEFSIKLKETSNTYQQYVPIKSDVGGAISGLLRLQRIYGFTAEQIANGNFSDKFQLPAKLTALDCFKIGQELNDLKIHSYAIGWYNAALNRINHTKSSTFPVFQEFDENIIRESLQHSKELKSNGNVTDELLGVENLDLLQAACRGHLVKDPTELRELYCKYETENHSFLKLAPIKVEILNLEPYLVIFHNIISDAEIEILKSLSLDSLERAGTWDDKAGIDTTTTYRTSKHTWIDNETHPVIGILNQRMFDMTGLSLETSEILQMANYGIGGHYDIHVDYSEHSADDPNYNSSTQFGSEWGVGDRIATILFYLSDVPIGGSTVWPYIKVKVDPVKGSAAFWYNLHYSLEGNIYTLHSSCPVVLGSKWAANKWIWSQAQMFKRPCLLEFDYSVEDEIEI